MMTRMTRTDIALKHDKSKHVGSEGRRCTEGWPHESFEEKSHSYSFFHFICHFISFLTFTSAQSVPPYRAVSPAPILAPEREPVRMPLVVLTPVSTTQSSSVSQLFVNVHARDAFAAGPESALSVFPCTSTRQAGAGT